ncbi:hypothetical protein ACFX2K_018753 [Malus domestica]
MHLSPPIFSDDLVNKLQSQRRACWANQTEMSPSSGLQVSQFQKRKKEASFPRSLQFLGLGYLHIASIAASFSAILLEYERMAWQSFFESQKMGVGSLQFCWSMREWLGRVFLSRRKWAWGSRGSGSSRRGRSGGLGSMTWMRVG